MDDQPKFAFTAVVGVDTHRDTHTAAALDPVGRVLDTITIAADARGYAALLDWAATWGEPGELLFAVEGTRSHGAGLTRALQIVGAIVTEVERPTRRQRRSGKSDPADAILAARWGLAHGPTRTPRAEGAREAARVLLIERDRIVRHRTAVINQMRDLVMTAPDQLRERLRDRSISGLLDACQSLRHRDGEDIETRVRIQSLRRLARRARSLSADADVIEKDLKALTAEHVPDLLTEQGVGTIVAAQLWISWSHPGRIRSESAFAALAGASPLEASSGLTTRHRLNRGGDRHLNRALHQIVITRMSCDPRTKEYVARRITEGKTAREARRCLKRYVARRIWRLLESSAAIQLAA